MSVYRFVEVTCDFCKTIIVRYSNCSKRDARRLAKAAGARLSDDKDFCDDNCYWKYEDKQAAQHRNRGAG